MEEAKNRFLMIKNRHKETYEQALNQGKVDIQMQKLCTFVAETKNYYTSSCCSGRIVLLEKKSDKKIDSYFHRKWHRTITKKELIEGFNEKVKGDLWFKVDSFILHIGTDSIENAQKIIASMKEAGVKRGGIILAEEGKVILEIIGTDSMSFPVKKKGKKIVENKYLEKILGEANKILERNYARLEKLEIKFRKNLE